MQKTTVRDWYLITFHDTPEPIEIIWGIIHEDPSGRWFPGDYVRTSPIIQNQTDGSYTTRNSIYYTVGPGTEVSMSITDHAALSAGTSPDEIKILRNLAKL